MVTQIRGLCDTLIRIPPRLWHWLVAPMAWVPFEMTCQREVERNHVTGEFRWRRVRYNDYTEIVGNWQEGFPANFSLDPLFSEEDRAAVLSHQEALARIHGMEGHR